MRKNYVNRNVSLSIPLVIDFQISKRFIIGIQQDELVEFLREPLVRPFFVICADIIKLKVGVNLMKEMKDPSFFGDIIFHFKIW